MARCVPESSDTQVRCLALAGVFCRVRCVASETERRVEIEENQARICSERQCPIAWHVVRAVHDLCSSFTRAETKRTQRTPLASMKNCTTGGRDPRVKISRVRFTNSLG